MTRPAVVLCGPMGSGKTSVGKVLARRWGVRFVDTDHEIERRTGRSVTEIFEQDGEPAFRQIEKAAVRDLVTSSGSVIALGGGSVMAPETRILLKDYVQDGGQVVFLDIDATRVAVRLGTGRGRPLLNGDPMVRWVELMATRRAVYEQLATVRIVTGGLTPTGVAQEIERLVGGHR